MALTIESLHIGMKVLHPRYGVGVVRSLTEHTADIAFDDSPRTLAPESSGLTSAEPTATLTELQVPLENLIRETAQSVVEALGLEKRDAIVEGLATRWQRGTLVIAISRHLAPTERGSARDVLSQDCHDPEQPARPRAEGKRER